MADRGGRRRKTIAIGQSISVIQEIADFEEASTLLARSRPIVVAPCACRKDRQEMAGDEEIPYEVCFMLGKAAQYYIDRGIGRRVEAEEAIAVLSAARAAGLISQPATGRNPGGLCNCGPGWCETLAALRREPRPAQRVDARCRAGIETSACSACETCLHQCPMAAVEIDAMGRAFVDPERCIGCGLCRSVCPTGAVEMIPRFQPPAS
jgi:ferredoxin